MTPTTPLGKAASSPLRLSAIGGLPLIETGDDLPELLWRAADAQQLSLARGVLVVCQKIVSKAEGRVVDLRSVEPRAEAREIANAADPPKDPRQVEVVLRETKRIVRRAPGVLICETQHGFVCANAGVDLSNANEAEQAILLPVDPDASAERLRAGLEALGAVRIAVVICDTFGRPWREGLVDVALGSSGLAPIADARGSEDMSGRELQVTAMATVDQLSAAAGLLMVKDAGVPAVWIEGIVPPKDGASLGGVSSLVRDSATDLFR